MFLCIKNSQFIIAVLLISMFSQSALSLSKKTVTKEIQDLDYGAALFEFYQGDYFNSITYLTSAIKSGKIRKDSYRADLLLGSLYLSYGLHAEAEKVFLRLTEQASSGTTLDLAWFWLAKTRYRSDLNDSAILAISRISNSPPVEIANELAILSSNLYMRKGNYAKSVGILNEVNGDDIWSRYALFNLAIAELKVGDKLSSEQYFKRLIKRKASTLEEKMLKDRASLALGIYLISENRDSESKDILNKIRLASINTNSGLLAAGWVSARQGKYSEALSPWMQLSDRPIYESSVAASKLSVAYSLKLLNALETSSESYKSTAELLIIEMSNIDRISNNFDVLDIINIYKGLDANSVEPHKQIDVLEESKASYFLQMLSQDYYRKYVREYSHLIEMQANLVKWSSDIDAFDYMLSARKDRYSKNIARVNKENESDLLERLLNKNKVFEELLVKAKKDTTGRLLASTKEKKQLENIQNISKKLINIDHDESMESYKQRYKLLLGTLQWDLSVQDTPRAWVISETIKDNYRIIDSAVRKKSSITRAMKNTSYEFSDFGSRIENLSNMISILLVKVNKGIKAHETLILKKTKLFLSSKKEEFNQYLIEARYSLANLYDNETLRDKDK